MREIRLTDVMPEAEQAKLGGKLLTDASYDRVVADEDTLVYKPDGSLLLALRKQVLPRNLCARAYVNLRDAAELTDNRGMASGVIESPQEAARQLAEVTGEASRGVVTRKGATRMRPVKKDGTVSNTNYAGKSVRSGVVGYFDRNPRFPYCRLTAYNIRHPGRFDAARPYFAAIAEVFRETVPERYEAQMEMVRKTTPEFVISGTPWTTVTVNRNFRTAVHKDAGDLRAGFGVLTVFKAGEFTGGLFVFPAYRVAVDWETGDVLLADVHEWHGNTEIVGAPGRFERLSCVLYYRERMHECGTPAEEVERAKRRQRGSALHGQ